MARMTEHLCSEPFCSEIVIGPGRCEKHRRKAWGRVPATPPGAYGWAWKKTRDAYIRAHPRCEHLACTAPASEVHHRNHDPLDNRWSNLEALCLDCHRRETVEQSHRVRRASSRSTSSTT
jgi:5-methylcytosine-specific restriction protein A